MLLSRRLEWIAHCTPFFLSRIIQYLLFKRFELPINGIVHSLFDENAKLVTEAELVSLTTYLNDTVYPLTRLSEPEWKTVSHQIVDLYQQSFAWYSGGPAVAIFVSSCQKIAMGGIIESSAYNPTINPLQVKNMIV